MTASFQIAAGKGAVFVAGPCKYKVLDASNVEVTGLKSAKITKISIPKTVKYGGKSFKVSSVANKAFQKTGIKEVVVGSNVKSIGTAAFKDCKKLKSVTIKSTGLKSVKTGAFQGIHGKASIKVPQKKFAAYKKLLKGKGQGKKVKIVK